MYKELINNATINYPFLIKHLNVKYIPHFHEEIELVYVIDGDLQFTLGNNVYTIKKGDICIILPNLIHNLFTHNFSKTFVTKIYPTADLNNIRLEKNIISANEPFYDEIKGFLLNMMEENDLKEYGYELAVNNNATNILLTVMRKFKHYKIDSHIKNIMFNEGDFLKQVDLFLKEHQSENLTLERIAEKFNYTKSYFCRYFKKITGMTFWQYYTLYRLEIAIEHIKTNSKVNLTQVALLSNFKNVRSFNNAFQSFYHCTPSEYRKMIIKNNPRQ